ncbi:MAG: GntR family transcriptional regulator [Clostridiaceae bacterium]|nr:GntR family transcriptional regulator [Clostridiaceae bacterium]
MTIYNNSQPATVDEVYQDMCERITSLQLEPGQKISENQICEDYGVSRSVIRTVFTRLNQRKLIEVYPQRGTYISKIDLEFIADLLLFRTAIEKEVLYEIFDTMDMGQRKNLTDQLKLNLEQQRKYIHSSTYEPEFKRLDSEFHRIMIDSVQRYNLMQLMEENMIHVTRWRNFDVVFDRRVPELICQHEAIYNAICDNDLTRSLRAMSDHLETISKIHDRAKAKYPQYFI